MNSNNPDSLLLDLSQISEEIAKEAEEAGFKTSEQRLPRLDVFLFFSFDLVNSTSIKSPRRAKEFGKFTWVDVIKNFYFTCIQSIREDFSLPEACVWKYVGDEILFYLKITERSQIETAVSAIFRTMEIYDNQLHDSQFKKAADLVSIKAVAWLSPVRSLVKQSQKTAAKHAKLIDTFIGDDQAFQLFSEAPSEKRLDFLGPNIDAGFRLATFARKRQLVVSPALAFYLSKKIKPEFLRVVDFAKLKGVAEEILFPGIWYNEKWETISETFDYQERHSDAVIKSACSKGHSSIHIIEDEVKPAFKKLGYFFEIDIIDEIIALSGNPRRTSRRATARMRAASV